MVSLIQTLFYADCCVTGNLQLNFIYLYNLQNKKDRYATKKTYLLCHYILQNKFLKTRAVETTPSICSPAHYAGFGFKKSHMLLYMCSLPVNLLGFFTVRLNSVPSKLTTNFELVASSARECTEAAAMKWSCGCGISASFSVQS